MKRFIRVYGSGSGSVRHPDGNKASKNTFKTNLYKATGTDNQLSESKCENTFPLQGGQQLNSEGNL